MRMIALCGPKGSGKDTGAAILLRTNENLNSTYYRRAPFAEGVKGICKDFFGWSMEQQDDPIFKETPIAGWAADDPSVSLEPRWAQMDIANWMRDRFGGGVHVRRWMLHAVNYEQEASHPVCHVITDLRFPEELEMLVEQDALIIYVARKIKEEELAAKQAAGDSMALNQSESFYDTLKNHPKTVIIPNDQEPYHLWAAVREAAKNKYGYPLNWKVQ